MSVFSKQSVLLKYGSLIKTGTWISSSLTNLLKVACHFDILENLFMENSLKHWRDSLWPLHPHPFPFPGEKARILEDSSLNELIDDSCSGLLKLLAINCALKVDGIQSDAVQVLCGFMRTVIQCDRQHQSGKDVTVRMWQSPYIL